MIVLAGKNIIRMEANGIAYLEEEGTEQFIDFEACFKNYENKYLSHEGWQKYKELNNLDDSHWEEHVERIRRYKEVAIRNIMTLPWADGPYIEFYTEPRIRFKFETEDEWRKLRSHIEANGWRTFDLS